MPKMSLNVTKCMKALYLDPYFQYVKYAHTSKLFVYLYTKMICLPGLNQRANHDCSR